MRRGRGGRVSGTFVASAVAAGAVLATWPHGSGPASPGAAAAAIAYAQAQLGKPYQWGAAGPDAFDCSGLVQQAYASAGVHLAGTSQDQWATEPHVSMPTAGDLVFFAGVDGTPSSPGHVGIVTDPATGTMIDAYAAGFPVEFDAYGPGASKPGLAAPVGFTAPGGA